MDIAEKDDPFQLHWMPMKKAPELISTSSQHFIEARGVINYIHGIQTEMSPRALRLRSKELKLLSFKFGGQSNLDQVTKSLKKRLHPSLRRFANEITRLGATSSFDPTYALDFWFNVSSPESEAFYNLCTEDGMILAIVDCEQFDPEIVENVVSLDHYLYNLLMKCKVPPLKHRLLTRLATLLTEAYRDYVQTRVVKFDYKKWRKPLGLATCYCGGFELAVGFMLIIMHRDIRFLEIGKWVFDLGPDN